MATEESLTKIEQEAVRGVLVAPVATAVKKKEPADEVVPVIWPVDELRLRPGGRLPLME